MNRARGPDDVASGQDQRLAAYCHLAGLGGLLFPLANFALPLFLWSLWRRRSSFVESHGREAVNFQFTVILLGGSFLPVEFFAFYSLLGPLDAVTLAVLTVGAIVVFAGVQTVRGARAAFHGMAHHYPLSLRVF